MGGDYNAAAFTKAAKVAPKDHLLLHASERPVGIGSGLEAQVKRRERWRVEGGV